MTLSAVGGGDIIISIGVWWCLVGFFGGVVFVWCCRRVRTRARVRAVGEMTKRKGWRLRFMRFFSLSLLPFFPFLPTLPLYQISCLFFGAFDHFLAKLRNQAVPKNCQKKKRCFSRHFFIILPPLSHARKTFGNEAALHLFFSPHPRSRGPHTFQTHFHTR